MKKVFFVFALLLSSSLCMADTVFLNDGQTLKGDIISESEEFVAIHVYNGSDETIDRKYIVRVKKDVNPGYRQIIRNSPEVSSQLGDREFLFKLGLDFPGTHEVSNGNLYVDGFGNTSLNGSQNVNSGMNFGLEYISYINDNLGFGGGLDMQSFRSIPDVSGNFSFFPLYGLVKLRTTPDSMNIYEYLIGQLGYNFFSGDFDYRGRNGSLDGGLYLGLGAGVTINNIQIELLYTQDRGKASDFGYLYDDQADQFNYFSESGDIEYSKLGLSIGFLF